MTIPCIVAREYQRVSLDRSGRARSNAEQHEDNRRAVEGHGWKLGEPYDDTGSASRYGVKARSDFDRLMTDIASGAFGADVLVLWESSRGSRRVAEWVDLIELCEKRDVKIFVTTHSRVYDPANPRDRRSLLEDAVDAEYEVGKMSKRIRRSAAANAEAGRPHSRVPYGFVRRYDPATRKYVDQVPHHEEADVVREIFNRLDQGHSLRQITLDFEERGIRSRQGAVFRPNHLRRMALNPAYAGFRVHDPLRTSSGTSAKAVLYEGEWSALVEPALASRVRLMLMDPERRTTRPGGAVHLVSWIAVCGVCGAPMKGEPKRYLCVKGCVSILPDPLDGLAERTILRALLREDLFHTLAMSGRPAEGDLQAARMEVESLRTQIADLEEAVVRLEITPQFAGRTEPRLRESLRAAEQRARQLATPLSLRGLITPGVTSAREWQEMPLSSRREVAKLLLTPAMIGEMRVMRTPRQGGRKAVPPHKRVVLVDQCGVAVAPHPG